MRWQEKERILISITERLIFTILIYSTTNFPELDFKIKCSKGTYIRSLAHDFGKKLDSGAYLKYLERYSIGDYNIKDCLTIDQINKLLFN